MHTKVQLEEEIEFLNRKINLLTKKKDSFKSSNDIDEQLMSINLEAEIKANKTILKEFELSLEREEKIENDLPKIKEKMAELIPKIKEQRKNIKDKNLKHMADGWINRWENQEYKTPKELWFDFNQIIKIIR